MTANATSGGSYTVTASANGVGSSVNFALTNTGLAPSFTTMPTSKTVCSTNGTTFIVAASNATAYQWRVNTGSGFTNLSDGTPYSGVTSTTLTIGNVAGLNGYQYQCVATGAGSTTSTSATLTVPPTPALRLRMEAPLSVRLMAWEM
ncbi:hypothetical protein GO730_04175 [Spirosoma sp. HMF3257]|uniref:Ig-like domain-containing protein n=1 Tax=Spirosoma telluris TaxID=2183553 RepID=A0A327NF59_9BACT|nr:hypothetical protein [Spirosoma telluris]RAI73797.1 hypothetical protein HMF3257_04140 [Spirosoma telluris]